MRPRPLAPAAVSGPAVATRRWPMAFGPRFFALLGAGMILLLPAFVIPRALWALGVWNVVVFAAWLVDLRRIPATGAVEVTRTWPAALTLNAPAAVVVQVHNRTRVALQIDAVDDIPVTLMRSPESRRLEVPPGGAERARAEVVPASRGDTDVGGVALRVRTAWAIAERWLTARIPQTVRVYPDVGAARRESMFLLRSRQTALEKRRARRAALGRDFESLRDYQPGDDPRDICWTVTARRSKPVTRVYQPERSQAVWLLVDGGRLLRARFGDRAGLDLVVDAALALSEVALAAGDRVGLVTYGRAVHERLAPSRGAAHQRAILDALATIRAERAEADHRGAAAAVSAGQKQRALIVWLTDLAETAGVPDVIEHAAGLSSHHAVVFALPAQPELVAMASAPPASPESMYRMLAVHEMNDRRETLLTSLRHRGVHVLELPPDAPAATLVDQYLSVKERNLI